MRSIVLVTGAAGFIGHHLVAFLAELGHTVRGVDVRRPAFEPSPADQFRVLDVRSRMGCDEAVDGVEEVYHLAAGGPGDGLYRQSPVSEMRDDTLMTLHMLDAARQAGVERFLFTSSVRRSPGARDVAREHLESLCLAYGAEPGLETRVVRLDQVYGPLCDVGDEAGSLAAAVCRRVAGAADGEDVAVPGGQEAASFVHVDDCVEGVYRAMRCGCPAPLELSAEPLLTATELAGRVARAAGKEVRVRQDFSTGGDLLPRRDPVPDLASELGWGPRVPLEEGLRETYRWIEKRVATGGRAPGAAAPPREAAAATPGEGPGAAAAEATRGTNSESNSGAPAGAPTG